MVEVHCVHDPSSSSIVKDGLVYVQECGKPSNTDSGKVIMPQSAAGGEVPCSDGIFHGRWYRSRVGTVLDRLNHVTKPEGFSSNFVGLDGPKCTEAVGCIA